MIAEGQNKLISFKFLRGIKPEKETVSKQPQIRRFCCERTLAAV